MGTIKYRLVVVGYPSSFEGPNRFRASREIKIMKEHTEKYQRQVHVIKQLVEMELGDGRDMDGDEDSGVGGGVAAGAAGLANNSTGRRMKELKELEDEGIRMILFPYVNRVLACK